ncbi:MAG: ABC transporter substrate-binding protein [Actinomycetota bacterium]|nr:ABC transporter substrate-binding protein [Actinomycetota bacterium]
MRSELDPRALPLEELRSLRAGLQHEDDVVSYVRRLAQARLDLVRAETARRATGESDTDLSGELPTILGNHLTGGPPRPPRPADDFSGHPLALALERLCHEGGSTDLPALADGELRDYAHRLQMFEQERSQERKELFSRIDALSAELVRRYRDGEADVDGLLAQD